MTFGLLVWRGWMFTCMVMLLGEARIPCTGIMCLMGCGIPSTYDGVYGLLQTDTSTYPIGSQVLYKCKKGYIHYAGTGLSVCGQDGAWKRPTLTCKPPKPRAAQMFMLNDSPLPLECGRPPIPSNTHISSNASGPSYRHGTVVQYTCKEGYSHLSGKTTTTCNGERGWDPSYIGMVCIDEQPLDTARNGSDVDNTLQLIISLHSNDVQPLDTARNGSNVDNTLKLISSPHSNDSDSDLLDQTDGSGISNIIKLVIGLSITALVLLIMIFPVRLMILSWRRRNNERLDGLRSDSIEVNKCVVSTEEPTPSRAQSPEEKQQMQRLFKPIAHEAPIQHLEDIEEWTLDMSGFEMSS